MDELHFLNVKKWSFYKKKLKILCAHSIFFYI